MGLPVNFMMLVFLTVGLLFLVAWLLQWLWNITMPQVFGLKEITYWQAFRLLIIAAILFGGPNSHVAALLAMTYQKAIICVIASPGGAWQSQMLNR